MTALTRTTVIAWTFALATVTAPALASDNWSRYGGDDCDATAFKDPGAADLAKISRCLKVWQAYGQPAKAKGDYRDKVVAAFKRLYAEGGDGDAKLAQRELRRLNVDDLPARGGADKATATGGAASAPKARKAEPEAPARERFDPPEPSRADVRKADRYFKYGFRDYKKDDYEGALEHYLRMVDAAPGYPKGHYNVACIYSLQGDDAKMAEHLQNLADMAAGGDDDAMEMLKKTRTDSDFDGTRETSAAFKRITGYARIRVQNAMGDAGEENIANLTDSLKKLGHEVIEVSPTEQPWKNPIVWYAPHSKATAALVMEVLTHPRTQAIALEPEQLKGYDIVIAWGDDVEGDEEAKVWVPAPVDAEKKIDDLARKQDQYLREPDKKLNEVERTLDTPERVTDKVDRTGDRVERSVDKVEDAADKVKGLFD